MKFFSLFLLCLCAIAMLGCTSQPAAPDRPPVTWTKDSATPDETEAAKEMVISQLKDPESARFGETWALNGSNGNRSVCGYVNAKNSYGGYTGQKMFALLSKSVIFEGSGTLGSLLPRICMPRTVK